MDITFIDETEKVPTEEIKEIENLLQFAAGFLEIAEDKIGRASCRARV